MPFRRHTKARPNVRADEIQTAAVAGAGEDVEAGFEPFVKAVRDFDRLMPGMIRRQRAIASLLRAFRCEVVVQLDHCDAARHSFRAIDLDLVIVLRRDFYARAECHDEDDENEFELASQSRMHLKSVRRACAFYNIFRRHRQSRDWSRRRPERKRPRLPGRTPDAVNASETLVLQSAASRCACHRTPNYYYTASQ